jgi:hypothetical protein
MRAIGVDLPRPNAGHEDVPVVIRAVGGGIDSNHARGRRVVFPVEEQQLDTRAAAGEDAEVDSVLEDRSAEGGALARGGH